MFRTIPIALLCWAFLAAKSYGQDVFVPRELKAIAVTQAEKEPALEIRKASPKEPVVAKQPATSQSAKTSPVKESPANPKQKVQSAKADPVKVPAVKEPPANPKPEKVQSAKADPVKAPMAKEPSANPKPEKVQSAKADPV